MKLFKMLKISIKQKKYISILAGIYVFLLGFTMFYVSLGSFIVEGIKDSGLSPIVIANNGIAGIIGSSNIGIAFLGLGLIYFVIIWIPKTSAVTQNEKDYYLEVKDNIIYIRFRDYEFEVKREEFQQSSLWKDKNGKKVPTTLTYQIYNYIMYKNPKIKEKEIPNLILKENIINCFKGIRDINDDEKKLFIEKRYLKNNQIFMKIWGIFSIYIGVVPMGLILYFLLININKLLNELSLEFVLLIICAFPVFLGFIIGGFSLLQNNGKRLLKKIEKGKMYIADAISYDRNKNTSSIKVCDGKHYIDEWFWVSEKAYNNDVVRGKLYVVAYKEQYVIDFISDYDLKNN